MKFRQLWHDATCIMLLFGLAHLSAASDQAQFGQRWTRNMVSTEKGLPTSFDPKTSQNIKWTAELGTESHSTPVVAQGWVFIGSNNGHPRDPRHQGDRSVLMCFEEASGKFLWQLVVPKITNSMFWDWPKAGICSTVTVEEDRVYLVSNRGEAMCLDVSGMTNGNDGPFTNEAVHCVPAGTSPIEPGPADADIVWLYDMLRDSKVRQHDSAHSSVLVVGDYLYVNTANGVDDSHRKITSPDAPSLIVLNKKSGKLVAQDNEKIGPRIFHATWSSPALAEVAGRRLIIFCGGDGVVYAFEPVSESGKKGEEPVQFLKKVWQFDPDPTGPKENVHRFTSNRSQSPSTIQSMPVAVNGRIYITVGGDLWWGKRQAWLKCFDASKTGDITKTGELWSYPLVRHSMATPAVYEGMVFVTDCGKTIHCVAADTGKPLWTHEAPGEFWASTLVADGKVYAGTRAGEYFVFQASKEKKLLGETDFTRPISATAVAANGVLYVATMDRLYAIGRP